MVRFGLCCIFLEQPIKFKTTTVACISKMSRQDALDKIDKICLSNANELMKALVYCKENEIGCFRVSSNILPIKTHPIHKYDIYELPSGENIVNIFKKCGEYSKLNNIRTCFHPDQFVVINSKSDSVINQSLVEIEYHAELAEWINADVLNIHGGGCFGDKKGSLYKFEQSLNRLSHRARSRITVENDDKTYTPEDLIPICKNSNIPLVYDVHHHRCNKDGLTVEEATEFAMTTWNREPMFHISSPINGWNVKITSPHHDYIDVNDFPDLWKNLDITVEIEAKAKELAVKKLMECFNSTV